MLFISETHRVVGSHQDDFEALYRDEWMPMVASDAGTRLAWFFNHHHGTSISFHVVTITTASAGYSGRRAQARSPAASAPAFTLAKVVATCPPWVIAPADGDATSHATDAGLAHDVGAVSIV